MQGWVDLMSLCLLNSPEVKEPSWRGDIEVTCFKGDHPFKTFSGFRVDFAGLVLARRMSRNFVVYKPQVGWLI